MQGVFQDPFSFFLSEPFLAEQQEEDDLGEPVNNNFNICQKNEERKQSKCKRKEEGGSHNHCQHDRLHIFETFADVNNLVHFLLRANKILLLSAYLESVQIWVMLRAKR